MAFVDVALAVGTAVGADALGATAATVIGGGLMGAGVGGLYSALTGGNIGQGMLLGGGLGAGGAGLGAAMGAGAAGATEAVAAPLTGANVAGTIASPAAQSAMGELAIAPSATSSFSPYAQALGSNAQTTAANLGSYWDAIGQAGNAPILSDASAATLANATGVGATGAGAGGSGIMDWLSKNKGLAALGGTAALGALMQGSNNKYGTTSTTPYNGNSLSSLHYNSSKYTPLTTPQPNPAYQPVYANYVKNPYNPYAAEGGQVVSMAQGGIADANPTENPSIGHVEQMSRDNAVGQNQMFPQSQLQTNAFSSATNTPMGSNMIAAAGDTNVDPYTGAEKFAMGGLASTKSYADGGAITPDQITANSVNYNNALMAQLQGALNTPAPQMNPGQVAQQPSLQSVPAQSYQGYGAPTFTRSAPQTIPFANPGVIQGTKAYNDRIAAEEAARKAAEEASMFRPSNYGNNGGGGAKAGGLMPKALRYDIGGFIDDVASLPIAQFEAAQNNPGQALIGANTPFETKMWNGVTGAQMRPTVDMYGRPIDEFGQLKRYAAGGKIPNHMAAIDDYVAQYQSDPAKVMAKAQSGDWNAMLAVNKIKGTPNQNYAAGGHLGGYSDGGRMLKGPGDGMSDNIPATIGGKQPARLADGEFVVPADVVSHLGNGSTDAGAKHLYNMMDKVRKARTGTKKQGKQIKPEKFLKG